MPKLARSFRQVNLPDGTKRFFFDEDEFPWFTEKGGLKVEDVQVGETEPEYHIVTMKVLVSGPVRLDDEG